MSLQGARDVLTDGEHARHDRSLAIEAYFDGWNQASGGPPRWFPRFLTRDEEESWRDGWNEAKAERAVYGDSMTYDRTTVLSLVQPDDCRHCPIVTGQVAA